MESWEQRSVATPTIARVLLPRKKKMDTGQGQAIAVSVPGR